MDVRSKFNHHSMVVLTSVVTHCKHILSQFVVGFGCLVSVGLQANSDLSSLKLFSLEELSELEVTIAGKIAKNPADIPAAVYILNHDAIALSGATTIPELLRMVPGLHVAQIDANKWVVASRGFSDRLTNKLLVMIDGRSVYSPLFGGVFWDQQDLILEDIDRIEVIRGPGASVWGANAVNGVINIISKSALDTQGDLVSTTLGSERVIHSVRHGGALSDTAYYRVYAKYRHQEDSVFTDGSDATDSWHDWRAGFRVDWQLDAATNFGLQGGVYRGDFSEQIKVLDEVAPTYFHNLADTINTSGANLLMRWDHRYDSGETLDLKVYFDHTKRDQWVLNEVRNVVDFDLQYQPHIDGRHELLLGMGYRYSHDDQKDGSLLQAQIRYYRPGSRTDQVFNFFLQDEITLVENRWWLLLGSKFEHNDYDGYAFQPNISLRWRYQQDQLLWASASRAVRTPTRAEHDAILSIDIDDSGSLPVALVLLGSGNMQSEELVAYEVGYRLSSSEWPTVDVSVFYNDYQKLRSFELGKAALIDQMLGSPEFGFIDVPDSLMFPQAFVQFIRPGNAIEGYTYGAEINLSWHASKRIFVHAHYSYLDVNLQLSQSNVVGGLDEATSPSHQARMGAVVSLSSSLDLIVVTRYVGELKGLQINDYAELDLGLKWQVNERLQLRLQGNNLLHDHHAEAFPSLIQTAPGLVDREFYINLTWQF